VRAARATRGSAVRTATGPDKGPAIAWLYGIAGRQLAHAARRGAVEDRARRRLGMAPLALTDERSNGSRRWRSAVVVCDNVHTYVAS